MTLEGVLPYASAVLEKLPSTREEWSPVARAIYDTDGSRTPIGECMYLVRNHTGNFQENEPKGELADQLNKYTNFIKELTSREYFPEDYSILDRLNSLANTSNNRFGDWDLKQNNPDKRDMIAQAKELGVSQEQMKVVKSAVSDAMRIIQSSISKTRESALLEYMQKYAGLSLFLQKNIPAIPSGETISSARVLTAVEDILTKGECELPVELKTELKGNPNLISNMAKRIAVGSMGSAYADKIKIDFVQTGIEQSWSVNQDTTLAHINLAGTAAKAVGEPGEHHEYSLLRRANRAAGNKINEVTQSLALSDEGATRRAVPDRILSGVRQVDSRESPLDRILLEQSTIADQLRMREQELQQVHDQAKAAMEAAGRDLQKIRDARSTLEQIDQLVEPYAAIQRDAALVAGEQRKLFGDGQPPEGFDYTILTLDENYPWDNNAITKLAEGIGYIPAIYGETNINQQAFELFQKRIESIITNIKLDVMDDDGAKAAVMSALKKFHDGDAKNSTSPGLTHDQLLAGRNRLAILQKPLPEKQEPDETEMEKIERIRAEVARLDGLETKTPITIPAAPAS